MLSFWGDLLNLSTNSSNAEQNISGETIRFEPAIATSNDGSFVIAWEQQEGDVERVAVQIFNADGSKRGPQFIAPTSIGDSQSAPAVSFIANGNFILGWDALIPGVARDVNFQQYDVNGNLVGGVISVDDEALGEARASITTQGDGFVSGYEFATTNTLGFAAIQRFNNAGEALGDRIQLDATSASVDDVLVTTLANGQIAVVWHNNENLQAFSNLQSQIFDADGTPITEAFVLAENFNTTAPTARVATLNNGNYVVVFYDFSIEGVMFGGVRVQVRSSDGALVNSEDTFLTQATGFQSVGDVTALQDGGFLVAWLDFGPDSDGVFDSNRTIRLQTFDSTGTLEGESFVVANIVGTTNEVFDVRTVLLADGRVLVTYETLGPSDASNSTRVLNSQIVDPRNGIVDGTLGNDILFGNTSEDVIVGLSGDDTIIGGAAGDTLDGGDDIDTLSYQGSATGVTVSLFNGFTRGGDATGDTFSNFENLTGSSSNDILRGDEGVNTLTGNDGNDRLEGREGDDILNGGEGADLLLGGTENDTISGGDGNDRINGQGGDDTLNGGDGTDRLLGAAGNDTLIAGDGVNNVLDGGSGADILIGSSERDIIRGQASRDTITGGGGNDALTGGFGPDTFIFNTNDGGDVINDFEDNFDTIDLSSLNTDFASLTLSVIGGDDALIDYGFGSIRLRDFDVNDLDAGDFDFA